MNLLISACLLGTNCRYNGKGKLIEQAPLLAEKFHLIPVCPEVYGGMPTPREPSERKDGKVYSKSGNDVTDCFTRGAEECLRLAELFNCKYAVLKEKSPSCGFGEIYDGTFSGKLVIGNGILAELLSENGITVIGESRIDELLKL